MDYRCAFPRPCANGFMSILKKIKAVKEGKAPMTPTEVYQFLEIAGYYWRFIEKYKVATPLTTLDQKDKKFGWETDKCLPSRN